jgi:ribosomal protein S18 acetylase RimI-like enzyme
MTDTASIQQTRTAGGRPSPAEGPQAVQLNRAEPGDAGRLSRLLAAAFSDDPILSWAFPDPGPRREILPAVFRTFADACQGGGENRITEDQRAGAVCLPPGREPDDAELVKLGEIAGSYAPRTAKLSELMAVEHPEEEPHFYLFFIGTDPRWQGRGIGSAMLEELLEPCDREGVPTYLDATSERNRRLYRRHGFDEKNEVRLPDGPPFWPMWREPR